MLQLVTIPSVQRLTLASTPPACGKRDRDSQPRDSQALSSERRLELGDPTDTAAASSSTSPPVSPRTTPPAIPHLDVTTSRPAPEAAPPPPADPIPPPPPGAIEDLFDMAERIVVEYFYGHDSEDGMDWIEKLELSFECHTGRIYRDSEKVAAAGVRLKDAAWKWFQALRARTQPALTWQGFRDAFRLEYTPDALTVAMSIHECRQRPGESITSYATRFRGLLKQAGIVDRQSPLAIFIGGLSDPGYRTFIKYHTPQSLDEAISQAQRLERSYSGGASSSVMLGLPTNGHGLAPPYQPPNGQGSTPPPYQPPEAVPNGHAASPAAAPPAPAAADVASLTEELRRLRIHLASNRGNTANRQGPRDAPPRQYEQPQDSRCWNCDEPGHHSRNCQLPRRPQGQQQNSRPPASRSNRPNASVNTLRNVNPYEADHGYDVSDTELEPWQRDDNDYGGIYAQKRRADDNAPSTRPPKHRVPFPMTGAAPMETGDEPPPPPPPPPPQGRRRAVRFEPTEPPEEENPPPLPTGRRQQPAAVQNSRAYNLLDQLNGTGAKISLKQLLEVAPTVRQEMQQHLNNLGPWRPPAAQANYASQANTPPQDVRQDHRYATRGQIGLTTGKEGAVCQAEICIEGMLIKDAIIDTGASNTCISHVVLRRLRLWDEMVAEGMKYTTASGTTESSLGHLRDAEITIGDVTIPLNVQVTTASTYTVLIGYDLLSQIEANIDLGKDRLTYRRDKDTRGAIPLHRCTGPRRHVNCLHTTVGEPEPSPMRQPRPYQPHLQSRDKPSPVVCSMSDNMGNDSFNEIIAQVEAMQQAQDSQTMGHMLIFKKLPIIKVDAGVSFQPLQRDHPVSKGWRLDEGPPELVKTGSASSADDIFQVDDEELMPPCKELPPNLDDWPPFRPWPQAMAIPTSSALYRHPYDMATADQLNPRLMQVAAMQQTTLPLPNGTTNVYEHCSPDLQQMLQEIWACHLMPHPTQEAAWNALYQHVDAYGELLDFDMGTPWEGRAILGILPLYSATLLLERAVRVIVHSYVTTHFTLLVPVYEDGPYAELLEEYFEVVDTFDWRPDLLRRPNGDQDVTDRNGLAPWGNVKVHIVINKTAAQRRAWGARQLPAKTAPTVQRSAFRRLRLRAAPAPTARVHVLQRTWTSDEDERQYPPAALPLWEPPPSDTEAKASGHIWQAGGYAMEGSTENDTDDNDSDYVPEDDSDCDNTDPSVADSEEDRRPRKAARTTATAPIAIGRLLTVCPVQPSPFTDSLCLGPTLTNAEKLEFKLMLSRHRTAFALDRSELGLTNAAIHTIDTGDAKPIAQKPYRNSRAEEEAIEKELDALVEEGVLQPSRSPWQAPIVMVPKKDGTLRLTIDYRRLNAVTVKDVYPIPQDHLERLGGATIFSSLDLRSGYFQVPLAPEDAPKTAFAAPRRKLEFTRLPMGLVNSPACFQRMMDNLIIGEARTFSCGYLDDCLIWTCGAADIDGGVQRHIRHVEHVISILDRANLRIHPKKCEFGMDELVFLGHKVSAEGLQPEETKTIAVRQMLPPRTVRGVRSFLGFVGYYRRFVQHFSLIARPLHELTKVGVEFIWDQECHAAWETLRHRVMTAPILKHPNFDEPFLLQTDWQPEGIGAILAQIQDGREHVIAYGSRALRGPELNYAPTEGECAAVVYFVKYFRHYLHGRRFTVQTDHIALKWLMQTKDLTGRLARWALKLQEYDFDIQYRPGKANANADGLSRLVPPPHHRMCMMRATRSLAVQERQPGDEGGAPVQTDRIELTTLAADGLWEQDEGMVGYAEARANTAGTDKAASRNHLKRRLAQAVDTPAKRQRRCAPDSEDTHSGSDNGGSPTRSTLQQADATDDDEEYDDDDIICQTCRSPRHAASMLLCDNCDLGYHKVCLRPMLIKVPTGRWYCDTCRTSSIADVSSKQVTGDVTEDQHLIDYLYDKTLPPGDKERRRIRQKARQYKIHDGKLYKISKGRTRNVPLIKDREDVIRRVHDFLGHTGINRSVQILSERYWWWGLTQHVREFIKNCPACVADRIKFDVHTPLHPIPVEARPWMQVGVDLQGPYEGSASGHHYVMVVICYFTKFPEAFPLKDKASRTVAEKFSSEIICRYGCPSVVITDRGTEFEASFAELMETCEIDHRHSSAYHPQTNGLVERMNRTIKAALSKDVRVNARDWDTFIPRILLGIRAGVQASTKYSPYALVFGRQPYLPGLVNGILGTNQQVKMPATEEEMEILADKTIAAAREYSFDNFTTAISNIQKAQATQVKQHDKRRLKSATQDHQQFYVGQRVLMKATATKSKELGGQNWEGPYEVRGIESDGLTLVLGDSGGNRPWKRHVGQCTPAPKQPINREEATTSDPGG